MKTKSHGLEDLDGRVEARTTASSLACDPSLVSQIKTSKGIDRLVNLRHLLNVCTPALRKVPEGFAQLTGIRTLREFHGGRRCSKLGYLNKLDQLSESLVLVIGVLDAEDVDEAQEAKLMNKIHIRNLRIKFCNEAETTNEDATVRNQVMEALQPPKNLHQLKIEYYKGTKFPSWTTYSLNNLISLEIYECNNWSTLPPLGKLPCLEDLKVWAMERLQFLGRREFLGIDANSMPLSTGGFPKLKKLYFSECPMWNEWEDITAEEEEETVVIMPCLRELTIRYCSGLTSLPHILLRKASSLQFLAIEKCRLLTKRYEDKNGLRRRSLSKIPRVLVY
ncbi:hypothetical protein BUALT_Bualt16G0031300 [Buddleja alternifolia]|uniref:R13L1/DRL21-like LRR repeat region domain-containing protein n=1 Tax=Buddleja alternifolia TaxID=168488 RepID=A0AAV6WEW1_9LAMI|nr:hypothetical protein BUALT_Bualt16G0031300 [Buddleja alternifolia]